MLRRSLNCLSAPRLRGGDLQFVVDNALRTMGVHANNAAVSVPFEWIVDNDTSLFDANDQRMNVVCPKSLESFTVENASEVGDKIVVSWRLTGAPHSQPTSSPLAIRVPDSLQVSHLRRDDVVGLFQAQSTQLSTLGNKPTTNDHPIHLWDSKISKGGEAPHQVSISSVADSKGNILDEQRVRVMRAVESYGFAVLDDPVFRTVVASAADLDRHKSACTEGESSAPQTYGEFISQLNDATVEVRSAHVRRFMESAFGTLRNSHYGLFSVWASSPSWSEARLPDIEAGILASHEKGSVSSVDTINGVPRVLLDEGGQYGANATKEVHQDGAYSGSHLDLHTDCTYFRESPKLQGFGCCFTHPTETQGGETVITDGFMIAAKMAKEAVGDKHKMAMFNVLCTTPVHGRYIKEGRHYTCSRPVIKLVRGISVNDLIAAAVEGKGVSSMISQISFNNSDRSPLQPHHSATFQEGGGMSLFYLAYSWFHSMVHDVDNAITFKLTPGQLLLFDNHRVLHGRLKVSGPRVMCGAYIASDEYYSALQTATRNTYLQ